MSNKVNVKQSLTNIVKIASIGPQGPTGAQGISGSQGVPGVSNINTGSLGSTTITGSLTVSGSNTLTNIGSFSQTGVSTFDGNITLSGSLTVSGSGGVITSGDTGSFVTNSQTSSMTVLSSSFATTASFISSTFISSSAAASGFGSGGGGGGGSSIDTGSLGNTTITGSLTVSGSNTFTNIGSFSQTGNSVFTGDITSSGNVSSSAASTASFGTYLGDGSQLTGISAGSSINTGSLGSTTITGSLTVSGSGTLTNIGPFSQTGVSTFTGNITASGNISSSGNINVGGDIDTVGSVSVGFNEKFTVTTYNTILTQNALQLYGGAYISGRNAGNGSFVTIDTTTGGNSFGFARLGVKGTGLGSSQHIFEVQDSSGDSKFIISNNGHITASGNISSSGNITALDLNLFGGGLSIKNQGAQSYARFYCESANAHYTELKAQPHALFSGNPVVLLPAYDFDFATPNFQANITASGNVSSSAASTASFGTYLGDGSQLTGISSGGGTPTMIASGSTSASADPGTGIVVNHSGSTAFSVIGNVGTLFSVDDSLTGTLFSANDISGFPVLQADSTGEVYLGKTPQSLYTTAVISSTTAATTHSLVSLSTSSYDGAFFEYTAISSSNARAGSIMSVWNGANIVSTETTSSQIGSTTDLTAEVIISQSQAQLVVYGANASYKVKTIIKAI